MSTKEANLDYSYLHERLDPIGWTPANNIVQFPASIAGDGKAHRFPLFEVDSEGDLLINYYEPNGTKANYRRGDGPVRHYQVTRYRSPKVRPDGRVEKYKHPSGTGTLAWFSPNIIEAVNAEAGIHTLVMVEGVLKAFAGYAMGGLFMVGLPGIHNLKDKGAGTLHPSILKVLRVCKPSEVVFLHDGDCRALTTKWPEDPTVDLYQRPNSFFTSARNMGELLKDHARTLGFRTYYAHVVSDSFNTPPKTEAPKGLDDLLLVYPEARVLSEAHIVGPGKEPILPSPERRAELRQLAVQEVVQDLVNFSAPPRFFERRELDRPDMLRKYFHLSSADQFYTHYQEHIGDKEFVYDGTKYQWDEEEKALKVKVPSVAKKYVRVGADYYRYVKNPNPHSGILEERLDPWKKGEIIQDNGKHFIEHIAKYDGFTNYPDHVAYREVISNCLNSYGRFEHQPDPDAEHPTATLNFLQHIFGSGTITVPHPKEKDADGRPVLMTVNELDLGLDYIKLLYEKPVQMLPILCLVSKERGTGKTTFFDWLQNLFGTNCTQIGAKDLESDFNSHYASKLLIIIDEALIGKQDSVEKMKHLSTAKSIMVNSKGIAQKPQPFFGKILLGSNNIRNFIRTDDDEVRFWVRKVPKIPAQLLNIRLAQNMVAEIPAFLHYLSTRPFATQDLFRSWFHPPLLVTDALIDVRKHSASTAKRTIEGWLRMMFMATREEEIMMTADDIVREMFKGKKEDVDYIRRVLKEDMELDTYRNAKGQKATCAYSYQRIVEKRNGLATEQGLETVHVRIPARPFVFKRTAFFSEEEWELLKPDPAVMARNVLNGTLSEPVAAGGNDDLPF